VVTAEAHGSHRYHEDGMSWLELAVYGWGGDCILVATQKHVGRHGAFYAYQEQITATVGGEVAGGGTFTSRDEDGVVCVSEFTATGSVVR
jgi:hypothetical protein